MNRILAMLVMAALVSVGMIAVLIAPEPLPILTLPNSITPDTVPEPET